MIYVIRVLFIPATAIAFYWFAAAWGALLLGAVWEDVFFMAVAVILYTMFLAIQVFTIPPV